MKVVFKKLIFEKKMIGGLFYLPFLVYLVTILVTECSKNINEPISLILNIYQFVIPVFCSWWIVFIIYEIYGQEGGELLLLYKKNRFDILLILKYFVIYVFFAIILVFLCLKAIYGFVNSYYLLYIAAQCFFYSALSFLAISIIKKT